MDIKKEEKIPKVSYAMRRVLFFITRICLNISYRYRSNGVENIPEGPKLFVPNHISIADSFVVSACLSIKDLNNLIYVSKEGRIDIIKFMSNKLGVLEFGRESKKVLGQLTTFLNLGKNVLIYPEGTRSKQLMPFKKGFSILAKNSKATIVPVALKKESRRYEVNFLDPIYYEEFKELSDMKLAEEVRERIADSLDGF